jgi:hypothetical protein
VDEPGNRVVDQAKTKHLHSRLSPFGPFNEIPVISDVRESACPKPQAVLPAASGSSITRTQSAPLHRSEESSSNNPDTC